MFDFSKRLEDFETGKPSTSRGARGKYNREERPQGGARSGERKGFGPGAAPRIGGASRPTSPTGGQGFSGGSRG
jgi:hypothetical protein